MGQNKSGNAEFMGQKKAGNVGDLVAMAIFMLAVITIMVSFFRCTHLLIVKQQISQLSRAYMLEMETEGYLSMADKSRLEQLLTELGATNLDFSGTTMSQIGYGSSIELCLRGKLLGQYDFEEKRTSTAKY